MFSLIIFRDPTSLIMTTYSYNLNREPRVKKDGYNHDKT